MKSITRVASRTFAVIVGDKSFKENCIYAEGNFCDMFSFPLNSPESSNVLSDINSIVISERTALKLFETTDCLGKAVTLKDGN